MVSVLRRSDPDDLYVVLELRCFPADATGRLTEGEFCNYTADWSIGVTWISS
jgi:hypothetical protein